jgi:hypothetical protein
MAQFYSHEEVPEHWLLDPPQFYAACHRTYMTYIQAPDIPFLVKGFNATVFYVIGTRESCDRENLSYDFNYNPLQLPARFAAGWQGTFDHVRVLADRYANTRVLPSINGDAPDEALKYTWGLRLPDRLDVTDNWLFPAPRFSNLRALGAEGKIMVL